MAIEKPIKESPTKINKELSLKCKDGDVAMKNKPIENKTIPVKSTSLRLKILEYLETIGVLTVYTIAGKLK